MKDQTNKKTIFLSHSTLDKKLADALFTVLTTFINDLHLYNYDVFYSPVTLNCLEKYSDNWKKEIEDAVKKCEKFILLWTPNSIENRWVNYEIGLAKSSRRKQLYAVGIKGLKFELIIPSTIQTIYLDDYTNVLEILHGLFPKYKQEIPIWATQKGSELILNLNNLAKTKTVFFSGSKSNIENWNETEVENFVTSLSERLLDAGFKLASYPEVENIGQIVAKCAIDRGPDMYEIAGLYKFDDDIDNLTKKYEYKWITTDNIKNWNKTLSDFREIYLKNKNFMIIIGGGHYTYAEYNDAKDINNLGVFPIPCFGGVSKHIYETLRKKRCLQKLEHPCFIYCDGKRDHAGQCPFIDKFVDRFKKIIVTIDEY